MRGSLRRYAKVTRQRSAEVTQSENGTGNRNEMGRASSTPKACIGGSGAADIIIHAAGVRIGFPSSARWARRWRA